MVRVGHTLKKSERWFRLGFISYLTFDSGKIKARLAIQRPVFRETRGWFNPVRAIGTHSGIVSSSRSGGACSSRQRVRAHARSKSGTRPCEQVTAWSRKSFESFGDPQRKANIETE